ncbi:MAG: ferredoxin [Leucobacter sp.]
MKVRLDKSKCQGHAMCNAVAPSVYPLDDEGYVAIDVVDVDDDDRDKAKLGVETCPERALFVEE